MNVKFLKDNGLIIYESRDPTETWDKNVIKGVYVLPREYMLGGHGCSEYLDSGVQLSGKFIYKCIKETVDDITYVYYELRYFLDLLSRGSLDALEMLFAGPGYGHTPFCESVWMLLYVDRQKFLTKKLKYSLGFSGLRILKHKENAGVNYEDFYTYIPHVDPTSIKTLSDFNKTASSCNRIDSNYVQLTHIKGDLYKMFYSFFHHTQRSLAQQKPESRWQGMKPVEGVPPSKVLSEETRSVHGMHSIGYVYFDSRAYNKAKALSCSYTNKEKAEAYKSITIATEAAQTKNIKFPVTLILYQDFLAGKPMQVDDIVKRLESRLYNDFATSDLPECIDKETLNKIESTVRHRFELISTIEQE